MKAAMRMPDQTTVAPVPTLAARFSRFKIYLLQPRYIVCRTAAVFFGALAAIFLGMVFDRRACVDIVDGTISPAEQHIGLPLRVTYRMIPHNYCDGEVTDFFRHAKSGFYSIGETRATGYAKIWNGDDKSMPFDQMKIVPDGLEGTVYYEPKVRRWHNELQRIFNPIVVSGIPVKFERLPKLPPKETKVTVPVPLVNEAWATPQVVRKKN